VRNRKSMSLLTTLALDILCISSEKSYCIKIPINFSMTFSCCSHFLQNTKYYRQVTCTWTRVGPTLHLNADATLVVRWSTRFFRSRSIQISRAARCPSRTRVSSERRSFDSESGRLSVITMTRKLTTSEYVQGPVVPVAHEVEFTMLFLLVPPADRGWHCGTSGTSRNIDLMVTLSVTVLLE